jgi:hypothetical protein
MTNYLSKWVFVAIALGCVNLGVAQDKKKKNLEVERIRGGADEVDGWIIRKLPDGRVVKVPKKQKFKFTGPQIEGGVQRPPETVLRPRGNARESSLIPVRKSFRQDAFGVSAYRERTSK